MTYTMGGLSYNFLKLQIGILLAFVTGSVSFAQSTALTLGSGSGVQGGSVSLNLSMTVGSPAPAGVQWTVSYPSAVTSISGTAGPALIAAGKTLNCAAASGKLTCLTSGMNSNTIASGVVATVVIQLSATSSTSVSLPLSNILAVSAAGVPVAATGTGVAVSVGAAAVPTVTGLSCGATVVSGGSASCTVTVSKAAPSGGTAVTITDNSTALTTPASVTVASGATSATFTATAGTVTANQAVTVTASLNGSSKTASVTVTPTAITVTGLSCGATVVSGGSASCTVTVSKAAPSGGTAVTITDNSTALTTPASVTVASGATSATFTATAGTVTANQAVTVTASLNGSSKTASVTVTPTAITVTGLSCGATVVSGGSASCTVTVSKAAPSGGTAVTITDNSTALTAPASVTVASGATSATFTATAGTVTANQAVTVTASLNGSSKTASVTVTPTAITVTGLSCGATVVSGGSASCTVTVSKAAPSGGTAVTITDNSTALTAPASVTVASGATSATFTATAGTVTANQVVTVTASLNGSSKTASVTVTPTAITVTGLSCGATVVSGGSASCTVTVSKAAPSGGTAVTITDNSTALTAPASVTVASGATSATFTATAGTVTANQAVTVTASLNGSSKTASVTIQAALTISLAYGFEEGSGTTTGDVSGNGVTGQIQGATWTTSGAHGKALSFNGSNSYVDLGNPTVLQSTGSMTWSAWVKPTGNPPDDGQIIARSDHTTGWQLKSSPDTGKRTFAIAISGDRTSGLTQRYSKTVYSLNNWYYVAGVYDAAARKLDIYVNGVLDNGTLRGSIPAAQYVPALNATIGRRSGGFYFKGTIDDVRVYKRALTASEVQTDMNAGLTALPPASMTSAMVSADNGLAAVSPQIAAQAITPDPKLGNAVGALLCSPRIVKAGSQVNCELRLAGGANTARVELASTSSDVKVPRVVASRKRQSSLTFVASVEPAAKDQGVTITASLDGTLAQDNIEVSASPVPVLSVPEKQFARFGSRLTFTVTGADSGGLPIQLAATNLPPGAIFDPLSGVFEWTPDATQAGVYKVTFTGTNFVRRSASAEVSIDAGSGAPVLNAASTCSPGAIGTLEGKWISESAEVASDPSASGRELGGTRVKVNGSYVPLLLVSLTQAKFICPALEAGTALSVAVETATGTSEPLEMKMQSASPEIFSMDVAGRRQGVISFPNSGEMAMERNFRIAAHPAEPGDEILIWGTGFGSTPVGVRIGGAETEVVSVEAVPGQPGVYTIRALIPAFIASGQAVPVQLSTAGITSEAVTIAVEGAVQ